MNLTPIPVATVTTKRTYKEFLLLKKSLEQYHKINWYVSADDYVFDKLQSEPNIDLHRLVKTDDCNHNSTDPIQRKNFLDLVLTKFDICSIGIQRQREMESEYDGVLFLDSDVFFVNPLEDKCLEMMKNKTTDMILSLHMTNNFSNEAIHGLYNVGLFYIRNQDALKIWKQMSANHEKLGMYYEQSPLTYLSRMYWCGQFPINYNIAWWRFNEQTTKGRLEALALRDETIYFGEQPAINVHVHTLKTEGVVQYGQFLVDKIFNLMSQSNKKEYKELLNYYDELQKQQL